MSSCAWSHGRPTADAERVSVAPRLERFRSPGYPRAGTPASGGPTDRPPPAARPVQRRRPASAAVLESQERLWVIYGRGRATGRHAADGRSGPYDLAHREADATQHRSFTYALFDLGETELLGCVDIDPAPDGGGRRRGRWWVVDWLVDSPVERALDESCPPGSRPTGQSPRGAGRSPGRTTGEAQTPGAGQTNCASDVRVTVRGQGAVATRGLLPPTPAHPHERNRPHDQQEPSTAWFGPAWSLCPSTDSSSASRPPTPARPAVPPEGGRGSSAARRTWLSTSRAASSAPFS